MDLTKALNAADVPVLLMVLVHLTGDDRWINPPFLPERTGRLFAEESGGLPDQLQDEVRRAIVEAIGSGAAPRPLDEELVHRMMTVFVGESVPEEYVPLALDELRIRPIPGTAPVTDSNQRVLIIGGGVSGICAAIQLEHLGIDYVVIDKNESVGGTWWENTYPEAGVDTPNHFYSFSFARNMRWTSYFSKTPEIHAYLQSCVDSFGIRKRFVLGAQVQVASYADGLWTVEYRASDGSMRRETGNVLITAVGQVNQPKMPDVPGIETYLGEVFHTAKWPTGVDLKGKRVALVGTGASAVQAARSIAADSDHLTIIQRSAQWIMPNPDYHRLVSEEKSYLLREVPFYEEWYRFGLFWRYADGVHASLKVDPGWDSGGRSINELNDRHRGFLTRYRESQLQDRPDLLAKAMPTYPPYAKRMVIDNDWFATLKRPDVTLVEQGLAEFVADGVVTTDGDRIEADVIVLATGFNATRMLWPLEILGRGGLSIHEAWSEDEPTTYLGMTTAGFPNLFMLLGPTTSLAHGGSAIFQIEAQVRYISECLSIMNRDQLETMECTPEAAEEYTEAADAAHRELVFSYPGVRNWYKNRSGRVVTVSPWRLVDYWHMLRDVDLSKYRLNGKAAVRAPGNQAS